MRAASKSKRLPVAAFALTLASLVAWILPAHKPNAVLGRLDYFQFCLAMVLSAAALSVLLVLLVPAARRRLVGLRVAAIWFGLVLALPAAELTAWLWPVRHSMDNPWYFTTAGGTSASEELPFERPPHLKWRGLSRGDLAQMNGDEDPFARIVTFETDMEGFRNPEDIGQADLIAIGDSFTEAGNLPAEENFTTLAGRKLGWKARNLGRSGYTAPSELIVLKKYGLRCRPKVIVWQIAESNDLSETVQYEKWLANGRKNYLDLSQLGKMSRREAWQRRSLSWRLFVLLRNYEPPVWPFAGIYKDRAGAETFVRFLMEPAMQQPATSHAGWKTFASALEEGAALCRSNGIQLVVLMIPMKYKVLGPYMQMPEGVTDYFSKYPGLQKDVALATVLGPLCAKLGVPFIDATVRLQEKAASGELVYLNYDTHLNSPGHEVVAGMIQETVTNAQRDPGR